MRCTPCPELRQDAVVSVFRQRIVAKIALFIAIPVLLVYLVTFITG
jgi:hypothetical protein